MNKINAVLIVTGLGVVAFIAYKLLTPSNTGVFGGGGGGGDDSGIHSVVTLIGTGGASARGQNSYSVIDPITKITQPFTYKSGGTTQTGVATYYAPPIIQNMTSPGSALPAPAPGIELAPRAIIL
jgi:hypothetical protein